jgi:hypothetical protein
MSDRAHRACSAVSSGSGGQWAASSVRGMLAGSAMSRPSGTGVGPIRAALTVSADRGSTLRLHLTAVRSPDAEQRETRRPPGGFWREGPHLARQSAATRSASRARCTSPTTGEALLAGPERAGSGPAVEHRLVCGTEIVTGRHRWPVDAVILRCRWLLVVGRSIGGLLPLRRRRNPDGTRVLSSAAEVGVIGR